MLFLGIVLQLSDFPGVFDDALLALIYPYCRCSLAERVVNTLRCGGSIDSLHGEGLDSFIPSQRCDQLRLNLFYQVQANGESLSDFVYSIRNSARILRLGLAENDIVQVILEVVTPQERSRLVFAGRPGCFADLERLCVKSRNIQANDESRDLSLIHI